MKKELILSLIAVLLLILLMLIFQIIVKETPLFSPAEYVVPIPENCLNDDIKKIWDYVFKESSDGISVILNESLTGNIETKNTFLKRCSIYLAYKIVNSEEVYLIYGDYSTAGGANAGSNLTYIFAIKANTTLDYINSLKNLTISNLSVGNTKNTELIEKINTLAFLKMVNSTKEEAESSLKSIFETSRFVFAQSPYFSSRVSKSNLDGAQEPRTRPGIYSGVLDITDLPAPETLIEEKMTLIKLTQNSTINATDIYEETKTILTASLNFTAFSYEYFGFIKYILPNITNECQQNWTIMKTNCTQEETQLIWNKDINACNITNSIYMQNKTEKCDFDKNNIIGKKDSIRAINLKPDIYIGTEVLNISKIYNTTKKIVIKENNISLVEFEYDFKEPLDLTKITIEKQPDDFEYGYILINGLNYTKTVRIERLDSFSSEVCIIDKEIEDISDFSSKCNSSRETLLDCPAKKGQVSCNITYDKFIVSGLSHSAAKEFILEDDKTTILNNTCTPRWNCGQWSTCIFNKRTRTCTDTNRCNTTQSKPSEQEACTPSPVLCTENWNCTEWVPKICPKDDKQKRNCTDTNNCAPLRNKREETRPCEYKKRSVALIISVIAILVAILSIISGIIYLLLKNKGEENAESVNYRAF